MCGFGIVRYSFEAKAKNSRHSEERSDEESLFVLDYAGLVTKVHRKNPQSAVPPKTAPRRSDPK